MAARGTESSFRDHQKDALPTTPPTPTRNDGAVLAGELSETANAINWPRVPVERIRRYGRKRSGSGLLLDGRASELFVLQGKTAVRNDVERKTNWGAASPKNAENAECFPEKRLGLNRNRKGRPI